MKVKFTLSTLFFLAFFGSFLSQNVTAQGLPPCRPFMVEDESLSLTGNTVSGSMKVIEACEGGLVVYRTTQSYFTSDAQHLLYADVRQLEVGNYSFSAQVCGNFQADLVGGSVIDPLENPGGPGSYKERDTLLKGINRGAPACNSTPAPTDEPTAEPTVEPTVEPTEEPTAQPTETETPTPEGTPEGTPVEMPQPIISTPEATETPPPPPGPGFQSLCIIEASLNWGSPEGVTLWDNHIVYPWYHPETGEQYWSILFGEPFLEVGAEFPLLLPDGTIQWVTYNGESCEPTETSVEPVAEYICDGEDCPPRVEENFGRGRVLWLADGSVIIESSTPFTGAERFETVEGTVYRSLLSDPSTLPLNELGVQYAPCSITVDWSQFVSSQDGYTVTVLPLQWKYEWTLFALRAGWSEEDGERLTTLAVNTAVGDTFFFSPTN